MVFLKNKYLVIAVIIKNPISAIENKNPIFYTILILFRREFSYIP